MFHLPDLRTEVSNHLVSRNLTTYHLLQTVNGHLANVIWPKVVLFKVIWLIAFGPLTHFLKAKSLGLVFFWLDTI